MSKARLAAAKELIQEKEYAAARAVLETISWDETAEKWLERLPPAEVQKPAASTSRRRWLWPLVMFIVGLVLGVIAGGDNRQTQVAAVPTLTETSGPSPTPSLTETAQPTATITDTPKPTATIPPTETPMPSTTPAPTVTPAPLIFNGTANTVIGPIQIPAGVYRATATTAGFFIASVTATEGECGAGSSFLLPGLFILSAGEATNGAEAF